MKRLIRAAEEVKENPLSYVARKQMKNDLKEILHKLWVTGGANSKKSRTMKDYKNSDYDSFAQYIKDHKTDIFDRDELMDPIYKDAGKFRDPETAKQYMLMVYDNISDDFLLDALGIH